MGGNKGLCSSYNVFMSFVAENGDASGILSCACYDKWVSTRKAELKQPEESFRRVLTAHVCGLIGRKPFPADIEASLLRCLRKKQVWPCFRHTNVTIGIKGFRKTGFHESRRGIFGSNALSSNLSPKSKLSMGNVGSVMLNPSLSSSSRRSSLCRSPASGELGSSRTSLESAHGSLISHSSHSPLLEYSHQRSRRPSHTHILGHEHQTHIPQLQQPQPLPIVEHPGHSHMLATGGERLEKDVAFGSGGSVEIQDTINEGVTLKRSYDSLDPLHIFNNSSPGISGLPANLQGFAPFTKRFKQDSGNEQLPLNSNLYPWKGVNSNFLLTSFQDIHVPTTPTAQCSSQNWPLA